MDAAFQGGGGARLMETVEMPDLTTVSSTDLAEGGSDLADMEFTRGFGIDGVALVQGKGNWQRLTSRQCG